MRLFGETNDVQWQFSMTGNRNCLFVTIRLLMSRSSSHAKSIVLPPRCNLVARHHFSFFFSYVLARA